MRKIKPYLINTFAILLLMYGIYHLCVGNTKLISTVWTSCVFMLMAASLNITMGLMGQLCLGQCGFMAIGAYSSTLIANILKANGFFESSKDPSYLAVLLIGIAVGGLASALLGLLLGAPALILDGDYLAIITLGFGLIIKSVLETIANPVLYREDCNMYIMDKTKIDYIFIIMGITAVCLTMIFTFTNSKYGRALISIRDDYIASSASGVNLSFYKILGFSYSAFFAGIAGVLYAAMMSSLATASFNFASSNIYNSIFIVVMVVMGGMGSFTGSVVTAALMVIINELISSIPPSSFLYVVGRYPMLLYGILLVIFIMFRPGGIFGTAEFSLTRLLSGTKKGRSDGENG